MENLSSAAAQGEQAFDPHHANGYNFTGADPNVRTLDSETRPFGVDWTADPAATQEPNSS